MIDLFSGIGGFSLAASWVWGDELEVVFFCEQDPFCRKVLSRHWPDVPIIEDINDEQTIADITGKYDRGYHGIAPKGQAPQPGNGFVEKVAVAADANGIDGNNTGHGSGSISQQQTPRVLNYRIDLLTAGPPCQPSSCAGLRKGTKDPRFLWPQALRAVAISQPRWVIFENPTGFLSLNGGMEYEGVCTRLERAGYWVEGFVVPASAVGAPHRRDRVWIVAESGQTGERRKRFGDSTCHATLPYFPRSPIREMQSGNLREELAPAIGDHWAMHWLQAVEQFCGVVHGVSTRVDRHRRKRIKALGNAIVPQVAEVIMRAIKAADVQSDM